MAIYLDKLELEDTLSVTRKILENAITTSSFGGQQKSNGQEAKNAAIRSSKPIQQLHGKIAESIFLKLQSLGIEPSVWPPIGSSSPELKVTGLLKAKDQDICFTVDEHKEEKIKTGVEAGSTDPVGFHATNRALVVGVRSQLSSVAKNFDTLVERAFAETLNLRLRAPNITLGEVYLIPLNEFDDNSLKDNKWGLKSSKVELSKFTRIFNAITDNNYRNDVQDLYKYNASMLLVADMSKEQVKILWDEEDVAENYNHKIAEDMKPLLPCFFIDRIANSYTQALGISI